MSWAENPIRNGANQTDLAVGLGHIQTNVFPTLAVTNKELDVRGEWWSPNLAGAWADAQA